MLATDLSLDFSAAWVSEVLGIGSAARGLRTFVAAATVRRGPVADPAPATGQSREGQNDARRARGGAQQLATEMLFWKPARGAK
jgi:hypothetical protein